MHGAFIIVAAPINYSNFTSDVYKLFILGKLSCIERHVHIAAGQANVDHFLRSLIP